ncbi:hypothetical protein D3C80_2085930 [compost metagenome]
MMCPMGSNTPENEAAMAPPMRAMSMKTSSPAYMLPNNRMPCETVLARYSMTCISRLTGHSRGWAPKGAVISSWPQPPRPLTLTL